MEPMYLNNIAFTEIFKRVACLPLYIYIFESYIFISRQVLRKKKEYKKPCHSIVSYYITLLVEGRYFKLFSFSDGLHTIQYKNLKMYGTFPK